MASWRKLVRSEEAIDFSLNDCDCDTSVDGLSSNEEDDLDCQLENNNNLENLR